MDFFKSTLFNLARVSASSRYAVGLLGGNELHLTPVRAVLNLKPSMDYLDKSDKTARAEGRALTGEGPGELSVKAEVPWQGVFGFNTGMKWQKK